MTETEQAAYDKGCQDTAAKLRYIYGDLHPVLRRAQSYLEQILDEDMLNSRGITTGMSWHLYNLGRNLQSEITKLNLET